MATSDARALRNRRHKKRRPLRDAAGVDRSRRPAPGAGATQSRAGMFSPRTTAGRATNASSARDVAELAEADQIARFVEADEVAHPREDCDVGDRIGVAHHPLPVRQMRIEHAEQALRLGDVAVARTLVLVLATRELVEEAELAEHRPDPAHLEHHPLDRLVAAGRILRNQLAGLVGEIDQDRARFEQRQRLALRTVRVEDRGNLVVRVQRQERRRELVVGVEAHEMRLVRQSRFLEHDRHLDAVRRRQRVELETVGMLGRPLLRDRKGGQIGHGDTFVELKNPRPGAAATCAARAVRSWRQRERARRKRPL